jgi:hypothetical protein
VRTPDEYRGLLLAAGFREARAVRPRLPVQTALVVARK